MTDTVPSTALELAAPRGQLDTFQIAEDAWRLSQKISRTEFVPKGLQGSPEKVLAAILKGHELQLPPMQALASIHVVNGRPGLSAELQRGLVARAGHEIWFEEMTATRVTCKGRRSDNGQELVVTWTMDDAKRAGLAGKDVWRSYPRNMLAARASADVCKFLFADVIGGLHTIEELEDLPPEEPIDAPALPAGTPEDTAGPAPATRKAAAPTAQARKKATPAKKAAAPRGAPPQPPLPNELDDEPAAGGDDDIVDAEVTEDQADAEPELDDAAKKRNQQIAMRSQELGLDRADVIYAVTGGRTTSARECTEDESMAVITALSRLKAGDLRLDTDGDEPALVDVERQVADEPPVADGEWDFASSPNWTSDQWRAFLQAKGVKVVPFIKEAQRVATHTGEKSPGSLEQMAGLVSLCTLMCGWVEEQAAGSAS